jgi:hypothetical protein
MKTDGECKGCMAGTQDDQRENPSSIIYRNAPNYPLNLQDPLNNQQCVKACDPLAPWDDNIGDCMSD